MILARNYFIQLLPGVTVGAQYMVVTMADDNQSMIVTEPTHTIHVFVYIRPVPSG